MYCYSLEGRAVELINDRSALLQLYYHITAICIYMHTYTHIPTHTHFSFQVWARVVCSFDTPMIPSRPPSSPPLGKCAYRHQMICSRSLPFIPLIYIHACTHIPSHTHTHILHDTASTSRSSPCLWKTRS